MGSIQQIEVPIIDGWGEKVVKQFSPSSLINMYVDENNSKESALLNTPGLSDKISFTMQSSYGVRAMYGSEMLDNMQVVVGDYIYQIDSSLNPIFGRKINTGTGYCSIEYNKDQILFADGNLCYLYSIPTGVYSIVTSVNAPPKPGTISVMGGRFFVNELDSDRLHISEIYDGSLWTGNVVALTTYSEKIVTHGAIRGRLFLLGTRCGNVWYLSDTYPYIALDNNLLLEYGCAAAGSLAIGEDRMCWLGKDRQGITSVVVTNGGMPEKISTDEIEAEFQKYDDVSDATAYIFKNSGVIFYQLNFTKQNKSFLHNFNTNTWSELQYKENQRHIANCHTVYNGIHFVGAYNHPAIYKLNSYSSVDYDTPIKRKFVTRALYAKEEKFIVHKLRVFMQQGTGTNAAGTKDHVYNADIYPKLFLRISEDNGITFSNAITGEIGEMGNRVAFCDFYRLGYFDYGSLVLDFEHYSPSPCNIFKILMYYSKI